MVKQILENGDIRTVFDNDVYHIETTRNKKGEVSAYFDPKTSDTQAMLNILIQEVTNTNSQLDVILVNLKAWADANLIPREAYDKIVELVNSFSYTTTFHQR